MCVYFMVDNNYTRMYISIIESEQETEMEMEIGTKFRLIGRRTEFKVVADLTAQYGFPVVKGHTLDGKLQTTARIADIVVPETEGAAA